MPCCPPLWYCTPNGFVRVMPDAANHYNPPGGFTGGPWATLDEALSACNPVTLKDCGGGCAQFVFPHHFTIAFVNKTGVATSLPNSKLFTIRTAPTGAGCTGDPVPCYGADTIGFGGACVGSPPTGFAMTMGFVPAGIQFGGTTGWALQPGWGHANFGACFVPTDCQILTFTIPCGSQLTIPQFVGTASFALGGSYGTADIYLTP